MYSIVFYSILSQMCCVHLGAVHAHAGGVSGARSVPWKGGQGATIRAGIPRGRVCPPPSPSAHRIFVHSIRMPGIRAPAAYFIATRMCTCLCSVEHACSAQDVDRHQGTAGALISVLVRITNPKFVHGDDVRGDWRFQTMRTALGNAQYDACR